MQDLHNAGGLALDCVDSYGLGSLFCDLLCVK